MISIFKFLTILATTLLGVIGSLINFRDSNNNFTKNGLYFLIAVVICGISAGSLQIYSDHKEKEESKKLNTDLLSILGDVRRTIHKFENIEIELLLRPDWDIKEFSAFHNEFETTILDIFNELDVTLFGGGRDGLYIHGKETASSEILEDTICQIDVELYFYKDVHGDNGLYDLHDKHNADLTAEIRNSCSMYLMIKYIDKKIKEVIDKETLEESKADKIERPDNFGWYHYVDKGKLAILEFNLVDVSIAEKNLEIQGNSKIVSVYDLLGSKLIIKVDRNTLPKNKNIEKLSKSIRLSNLLIKLNKGITLHFNRSNFTEFTSNDGYFAYEVIFPESIDKFIERFSYDFDIMHVP